MMPARSPTTSRSASDVGAPGARTTARRTRRRRRPPPRRARGPAAVGANICRRSHDRCTPGRPWVRPPLSTSAQHRRRRRWPRTRIVIAAVAEHDAVAGIEVGEQRRVVDGDDVRRCSARRRARARTGSPGRGRRRRPGTTRRGSSGPGRSASTPIGRPTSAADVANRAPAGPRCSLDRAVAEVEPARRRRRPAAAPRAAPARRWPARAWPRSSCAGSRRCLVARRRRCRGPSWPSWPPPRTTRLPRCAPSSTPRRRRGTPSDSAVDAARRRRLRRRSTRPAPWADVAGRRVRRAAAARSSRGAGRPAPVRSPVRIVGAHTDSPEPADQAAARHRARRLAPARRRGLRRRAAQQLARPRPRRRRAGRRSPTASTTLVDVARADRPGAAAGHPPRPRRQRARPGARPAAAPAPGVGRPARRHRRRSPTGSPTRAGADDAGVRGSCACTTCSRPRCSAPTARCWPAAGSTTRCRAGRRRRRWPPPSRPTTSR